LDQARCARWRRVEELDGTFQNVMRYQIRNSDLPWPRKSAAQTAICLLISFAGGIAFAQEVAPAVGVGVRAATPEEIRRSIEAEDRLIQATQPIAGLPQRLAYYIRRELPAFSVLGQSDATPDNWHYATEHGQPSPFICFGDFDGNGLEDAAVVLRE